MVVGGTATRSILQACNKFKRQPKSDGLQGAA